MAAQAHRFPYLPVTDVWAAQETARRDRDAAIPVMRQAVDELRRQRTSLWRLGHRRLVQTLLERGTQVDLAEAQDAIDRLANFWEDDGTAMREITLLRLRALLSRARGDDIAYRDYRDRYRAMAESLGFEGHIGWAKAMVEGGP